MVEVVILFLHSKYLPSIGVNCEQLVPRCLWLLKKSKLLYLFYSAKWNGLTVADLVFPWFMWIMGVSLVISMQSQLRNSKPRSTIVLNIIRRSVILFSLGLIINSIGGNNDFRTMRIPGVLQRFGITYFIVGIIQAVIASEELPRLNSETNDVPWWWCIRDVKACMGQWMVMLILLVLYLYLTLFMPVPGEYFHNFITLWYN